MAWTETAAPGDLGGTQVLPNQGHVDIPTNPISPGDLVGAIVAPELYSHVMRNPVVLAQEGGSGGSGPSRPSSGLVYPLSV